MSALKRYEDAKRLDWLERHWDEERVSARVFACRTNREDRGLQRQHLADRLQAVDGLAARDPVVLYRDGGSEVIVRYYLSASAHWRNHIDHALLLERTDAASLLREFAEQLGQCTLFPDAPFEGDEIPW